MRRLAAAALAALLGVLALAAAPPSTPTPAKPVAPGATPAPAAAAPAPAAKADDEGGEPETEKIPLDARLFAQATAAAAGGRRDEAMKIFRRIHTEFPDSPMAPPALLKSAEMLYPVTAWSQIGAGSGPAMQQAADLFGRLAQKYRASNEAAQALVRLGYLALEPARPKIDVDEACTRFTTAVQMYPDSDAADEAGFGSGMCELLRGRPARAAEAFGSLLTLHPDSPLAEESLYRYGVALSRLDDAPEAMLALQRLRTRAPNSPFAAAALDRITLLHRLRLLPALAAGGSGGAAGKGAPSAAAGTPRVDWKALYRIDADYGAALAAGGGPAKIRGISDLSIDPQGLLVAASPRTPAVFRLDARGGIQEQIAHPGPDHIAAAEGLAIYISGGDQIAVNARNWSGPSLPGANGHPPSDYGPIALDALGRLHMLDRRENAVLVYDRSRRLVAAIRPADKEGRFVDLASSDEGTVVALDGKSRVAVLLDQQGESGHIDLAAAGLTEPEGLAVDGLGNLYVLDARSGNVSVLDPKGAPIAVVQLPKEAASRIGEVAAVAVDAQGRIYLGGRKSGVVVRLQ
jgi:TolA-binding protein